MIGLRRYETAPRRPLPPHGQVHTRCGAAKLLHVGGAKKYPRRPVVMIPSLINPHHILDLSERASLARYLGECGHDPWLVDWGHPDPADAGLDLAGHIEQRLLPLLRSIGEPPLLLGYCLGGTLALAAAQLLEAPGVATIAAPWHFDRFPQPDLALIASLWREAKPLCERLGYVPMEVLQSGFWALDPARTIRKYAAFADMENGSEAQFAFLAVEDWANEGAPLTFAAGRELFEDLYGENLPGSGKWIVGGQAIEPSALPCPSLSVRSMGDRIVPAAASPALGKQHESALGHVGMIVSSRAPDQIWSVLSRWLSENGG